MSDLPFEYNPRWVDLFGQDSEQSAQILRILEERDRALEDFLSNLSLAGGGSSAATATIYGKTGSGSITLHYFDDGSESLDSVTFTPPAGDYRAQVWATCKFDTDLKRSADFMTNTTTLFSFWKSPTSIGAGFANSKLVRPTLKSDDSRESVPVHDELHIQYLSDFTATGDAITLHFSASRDDNVVNTCDTRAVGWSAQIALWTPEGDTFGTYPNYIV